MKLVLSILILSLTLLPKIVNAQDLDDYGSKSAIGVDPAIMEEVLDVNNPSQRTINVFNLSNLALPIKVAKMSFTPQDKLNYPEDKLSIYDASSWIEISKEDTDFILQPQSKKSITLTITQPSEASPGGHYATIYFEPLIPAELVSQQSVFVYARAAVLIFMQTRGDIVENLKIKSFNANTIYESVPFKANLSFENIGNTHLLPKGKVDVYDDIRGILIKTYDLNPSLILPGTEKQQIVDIDPGFSLGKISAQFVLTYGANNQVIESDRVQIYIFPYKAVLLILIVAFILIFLRKRILRAFLILFDIKVIHNEPRIKLNTELDSNKNLLKKIVSKSSRIS